MKRYLVPAQKVRSEIKISNSRFIATLAPVMSTEEARNFISSIRNEFWDASHNVHAYIIGFGTSAINHCSDDGEPQGTAGRPCLNVLQGSGMGNIAIIVTRYFGGTKLGIGGLVRAYTEAAQKVVAITPRAESVPMHTVVLEIPYSLFEKIHYIIHCHQGDILDQDFKTQVTITARFPTSEFDTFNAKIRELSRGASQATIIETQNIYRLIKSELSNEKTIT